MELDSSFRVCTICLKPKPLTKEHIIPDSLGGTVVAYLQCGDCNHELGRTVVSQAKGDPLIQTAIWLLRRRVPSLFDSFGRRQQFIGTDTSGLQVPMFRKGGRFSVQSGPGPTDSLVLDEHRDRRRVEELIQAEERRGIDVTGSRGQFVSAPPNQAVTISPRLTIIKRCIDESSIFPDHRATRAIDNRLPVLIAYNWLCLLLRDVVLDVNLQSARDFVRDGGNVNGLCVETIRPCSRYPQAHHKVCVIQSKPLRMKVILFGWLEYSVTLPGVGVHKVPCHTGIQELEPPDFWVTEDGLSPSDLFE